MKHDQVLISPENLRKNLCLVQTRNYISNHVQCFTTIIIISSRTQVYFPKFVTFKKILTKNIIKLLISELFRFFIKLNASSLNVNKTYVLCKPFYVLCLVAALKHVFAFIAEHGLNSSCSIS